MHSNRCRETNIPEHLMKYNRHATERYQLVDAHKVNFISDSSIVEHVRSHARYFRYLTCQNYSHRHRRSARKNGQLHPRFCITTKLQAFYITVIQNFPSLTCAVRFSEDNQTQTSNLQNYRHFINIAQ